MSFIVIMQAEAGNAEDMSVRAEENRRVSEVEPWPIRSARQDPRKQALIMRHASNVEFFCTSGFQVVPLHSTISSTISAASRRLGNRASEDFSSSRAMPAEINRSEEGKKQPKVHFDGSYAHQDLNLRSGTDAPCADVA